MDPAIARPVESPASFDDGLGTRRSSSDRSTGDAIEILCLRETLTQVVGFEDALRERADRLAGFRHASFARVRNVEPLEDRPSTLTVVSDRVAGVRLSDILATSVRLGATLEINAALCLLRQLIPAVALLHEQFPDLSHGAIGLERIVVTPNARIVVVEHVLGSALERLQYPHARYWQELHVALPRSAGAPRLDRRADVVQLGVVALSLILGRPIADDEYPARIGEAVGSAWAVTAGGSLEPLPAVLRSWLSRALHFDVRNAFPSAVEAQEQFDELLNDCGYIAAPATLEKFLSHVAQSVVLKAEIPSPRPEPPALKVVKPQAPPQPRPVEVPTLKAVDAAIAKPEPAPPVVRAEPAPRADTAAQMFDGPLSRLDLPAPKVEERPVQALKFDAPSQEEEPAPIRPEPIVAKRDPVMTRHDAAVARLDPVITKVFRETEKAETTPAARTSSNTPRLIAAAVALAVLAGGGWFVARKYLPSAAASATGTLSVNSNPNGAPVSIDGQSRGVTPLTLSLPPGPHSMRLGNGDEARTLTVTIAAGTETTQYLELPKTMPTKGQLQIRTEPSGAKVAVDGQARGAAPVTIDDLAPGTHSVSVEGENGSVTEQVTIEAGATASLVVPLGAPQGIPVSGWLTVSVPTEMQVLESGRVVGTTRSERIMMSAGRHDIEIVNDALGYRTTKTVQVSPGKVTSIKLDLPKGTIALNALPWADVWIDGERVGETPIGNLSLSVGPHDVVFRHPELGEQKYTANITLTAPARLSVDMRKK